VHAGLTSSPDEIYGQPIELLSRKVPGLPPELDKVMLRALAVEPSARYQTAGELQEALLRVAHRHGLLMSAPELAEHLREVCGPSSAWRDGELASGRRGPGTELYDRPEGTERLDVGELEGDDLDGLISVVMRDAAGPIFNERHGRKDRAHTSITNLSRLQGLELTSMINISGLADHAGARPLVDLDESPPRPRRLDSSGDNLAASDSQDLMPAAILEGPPTPVPPAPVAIDHRRSSRPWLVITLILLVGIGVAAAIGLSGPRLGGEDRPTVDTPGPQR